MEKINELESLLSREDFIKIEPVLRHSIFLRNRIINDLTLVEEALKKIATERTTDLILQELLNSGVMEMDEDIFMRQLRRFKFVEYIIISIKELYFNDMVENITANLSAFASAIIEIAYRYAYKLLTSKYGTPLDNAGKVVGFAVIGLGKLGGWELNFSSDIDLMYVYETEKGKTTGVNGVGGISNHEFFVKLGEKIKYYINERTVDGFVYRVDLRLRPDGDRGPLAMPLRSYETYYEIYGQSWERMMLLKGRTVAGDIELGDKLLKIVRPFIFRRTIDYKLINDLLDVKSKIAGRVRLKGDKKDVKLGYGGIREIEFTIQALQILNYPKKPDVYDRNSLISIGLLESHGILSKNDAEILYSSYRFLRKLEHMAQIENEQQTHVIPESSDRFELYIERCGFKSKEEFYKAYDKVTSQVNKIFSSVISEEKQSLSVIITDEELGVDDLKEYFANEGFSDPEQVAQITSKMFAKKGGRIRGQSETNLLLKLIEIILNEVKSLDNPVKVLNFFERFFMRPDTVYLFYDIFLSSPIILKKLIAIIDYSSYLSNLILQNRNLLDYIYDPKDWNYSSEDIFNIFVSDVKKMDNEEFEYNLTRKKFQELFFNVAYAYLNSEMNVIRCGKSLTELAKGVVNFAFQREYDKLVDKIGFPMNRKNEVCEYLILGMGKLGSGEMSFGSDLDLIVLYEEEGFTDRGEKTNQEFFSRLVQKVISYLATPTVYGFLYSIDMRLRPSGAKGALVTTLKSFSDYQHNKAMLWEKQALLRAGVVNEKSKLKEKFDELVDEVIYKKTIGSEEIQEISDMRMRIQKEKGEPYDLYDIKSGFGGIIDVEFIIQMFKLKYGRDFNNLKERNSHDLLHNLLEDGLIKSRDFYVLHNNYIFFRNLENIIRIYDNKTISRLPKDKEMLRRICRFLYFKDADKLFSQLDDGRKVVRGVFNRIMEQQKGV